MLRSVFCASVRLRSISAPSRTKLNHFPYLPVLLVDTSLLITFTFLFIYIATARYAARTPSDSARLRHSSPTGRYALPTISLDSINFSFLFIFLLSILTRNFTWQLVNIHHNVGFYCFINALLYKPHKNSLRRSFFREYTKSNIFQLYFPSIRRVLFLYIHPVLQMKLYEHFSNPHFSTLHFSSEINIKQ